jgi:SUMO ligase MMS21 Smc5/6 complex component
VSGKNGLYDLTFKAIRNKCNIAYERDYLKGRMRVPTFGTRKIICESKGVI